MATIEVRKTTDGKISYRCKVRLKGYPSQTATFDRKSDAKVWGSQTEAAIRNGKYFHVNEARKHSFEELVIKYENDLKIRNPARYEDIKWHLTWWKQSLGVFMLSDITKPLIIEQRDRLLNDGGKNNRKRSPSTVNRFMTVLGHVLMKAVNEWEWLHENPLDKISKFQEPRGRIRFLDDEERKTLLDACKSKSETSIYLLVVLALSTGARHGELIKLRWENIDFHRNVVVLHDTKNKERRILPITHLAQRLMKEHQERVGQSSDLVFPSPQNTNRSWNSRTTWLNVLKRANIADFRFHDLRHSAASYLAMNGATSAEIAEVLGHKTLSMVKRYAHLSEAHTASVVQRMNEKIFS